jgi:hypothetical protein
VNNGAVFLVIAMAAFAAPTVAQPTGDTAKYQPAILNVRACIRGNAPPAHIAGIRDVNEAYLFFKDRCYVSFDTALTKLGAGDAAPGSFRLLVQEEWAAFRVHINSR